MKYITDTQLHTSYQSCTAKKNIASHKKGAIEKLLNAGSILNTMMLMVFLTLDCTQVINLVRQKKI